MKKDPANLTRWKHKFGFHNSGVQWLQLMTQGPRRQRKNTQERGAQKKKPRDLEPMVLETPVEDKLMLEIRSDRKTIVEWVNGHAMMKTRESTVATAQNLLRERWGRGVDLRRRVADLAVNTTKKPISGLGKESEVAKRNGLILRR